MSRSYGKLSSLLLTLVAFNLNLDASPCPKLAAPDQGLTIRVYDNVRLPADEYEQARRQAQRIFARAGVPTRWIKYTLTPDERADPGCKEAFTPADLILKILSADMAARVRVNGRVFGYAVPPRDGGFGAMANVFHHRVAELIAQERQRPGRQLYSSAVVLGHIIAHELGHVLLGRNSHSRSGIMAFPWGPKQLKRCLTGGLLFSKSEAATIRREAQRRQRASQTLTSAAIASATSPGNTSVSEGRGISGEFGDGYTAGLSGEDASFLQGSAEEVR